MRNRSTEPGPVGVVPRHQAGAIDALMSDQPETCTVAESVETPAPAHSASAPLSQWLSYATAFGLVAAALEWLKLTR